jgi:hypothetical protein
LGSSSALPIFFFISRAGGSTGGLLFARWAYKHKKVSVFLGTTQYYKNFQQELKRNLGCKGVGVPDWEIKKLLGAKVPLHNNLSENRGILNTDLK